ncbi:MAG: GNAT family N-acetyltransferase [Chlamydiales bacterium]|nr:GNAT family N-acetyltransferase [Chlamydiales bacterium]
MHSLTTNITYVAEDKGAIIGFGDMTQTGVIDRLYVYKNYQGKGVARAIFKKLEKEARRLGIIELTTDANAMGKAFVEKQGFELVQTYRKTHRGVEFINYIMRKKL